MNTQEYLTKRKKRKWIDVEMKSFRFKKLVAAYNSLRLTKDSMKITDDEYLELAKVHRPVFAERYPKTAIAKTKATLRRKEVVIYADALLATALEKNGVDAEFLVGKRKEVLTEAIKDKQLKVANETLDVMEDYVGIRKTTSTEESVTAEHPIDYEDVDAKAEDDEHEVKKIEQPSAKPDSSDNS